MVLVDRRAGGGWEEERLVLFTGGQCLLEAGCCSQVDTGLIKAC